MARNLYSGLLEGTHVIVHQVYRAQTKEMMYQKVGSPLPAHQNALGKIILAHLEPSAQLHMHSKLSLPKATDRLFTDPVLFLHHLEAIKQQQYATDYEEFHEGLHCIASPVLYGNSVIASLGICDTSDHMPRRTVYHLNEAVDKGQHQLNPRANRIDKTKSRKMGRPMSTLVQLGKSELYVHPIGLGTNAVGGHNLFPNTDEAAS